MELDKPINTFLGLLAAHRAGGTVQVLDDKVREIVGHLDDLNISAGVRKAKATLTLTIDFESDDGVMKVMVKPKTKLPEPALAAAHFWTAPDGALVQNDPRQGRLNLSDVSRGRRIVDIPDTAGRDS